MPFIEEDKFKLMQEDLDNAKLKREEADNELNKVQDNYNSFKKKSKITPIIFGILFGISAAAAYYFYSNGTTTSISDSEIATIKKQQTEHVLDSIKRAEARAKRNNKGNTDSGSEANSDLDVASVDKAVTNKTKGKTVYSVQIGVLSKKKYPLLSSEFTAGISAPSNNFFKYSVGVFSTLTEAKKLRRELVNMGFEDAFVASYVNGKRQKIHH